MATSEGYVRRLAQFLEIEKRIGNESLTAKQVREAFQALITAPHAQRNMPLRELVPELDGSIVRALGVRGINTPLDLTKYDELSIVRILVSHVKGYNGPDGKLIEAFDHLIFLRLVIEKQGLKFQGSSLSLPQLLARF
jgi:hypothetical protein